MQRWLSLVVIAGLAVSGDALAAPGGGGSGSSGGGGPVPPPNVGRTSRDHDASALATRDAAPSVRLEGRVLNRSGDPLSGVMVKMFANGVTVASANTDVDGSFAIEANPAIGGNNTTDVWFQAKGPTDLLPTNVILALGSVADTEGLYSPCTPRVSLLGGAARVDVTMMTLAQRKTALDESGCLSRGQTP